MCKHVSCTHVKAWLDDGTPVTIKQCDMCGLVIPGYATTGDADPPPIDEQAMTAAYRRLYASIVSLAESDGARMRLI